MRTYANITNGLVFPHDDVCNFMSTHGHSYKVGYLRIDSMPYSAVIELLCGRSIKIVDATQHNKPLTDGLKFGLTTWLLIFNRAIGRKDVKVVKWQTPEMWKAANFYKPHEKIVRRIRRLCHIFPSKKPAIVGENVFIECYRLFKFDDKPDQLRTFLERKYNGSCA